MYLRSDEHNISYSLSVDTEDVEEVGVVGPCMACKRMMRLKLIPTYTYRNDWLDGDEKKWSRFPQLWFCVEVWREASVGGT